MRLGVVGYGRRVQATTPTGTALLTGVTGFVGSHLARRLFADGVVVHAVVRPGAGWDRVPDLRDRVVVHVDDGTPAALDVAAEAAAGGPCFHLATHFVAQHGPGDVPALVAGNVAFPARVADAVTRAGGGPFVNVGTAWQHVGGAAYRPKNLYAATKQALEDVLAHYADGLDVVTVNLYDTYGPLDRRGKLVALLLDAAADGGEVQMSSGHQLVDLVHVDDVVDALLAAAGSTGPSPRRYAAGTGAPASLRELIALVQDVTGRPLDARWAPGPIAPTRCSSPGTPAPRRQDGRPR
jgi:nucleoside-diphosphate-sugar epimerase